MKLETRETSGEGVCEWDSTGVTGHKSEAGT